MTFVGADNHAFPDAKLKGTILFIARLLDEGKPFRIGEMDILLAEQFANPRLFFRRQQLSENAMLLGLLVH